MFCLTVHRFLARVQWPTCTTYGKFLLESIMAMLIPKSGILVIIVVLSTKVMVIKTKHSQSKNTLKKRYYKSILRGLKSDTWKILLTIAINFMSSRDNDKKPVMYSKRYDIKTVVSKKTDEVIKELFESLLSRYQIGLEE